MKTVTLLIFASLLVACPKSKPAPGCQPDDGGTTVGEACAGKPDGAGCCLGATAGKCRSNECAPGAP